MSEEQKEAKPKKRMTAGEIRAGLILPGNVRCRPALLEVDPSDPCSCRIVITEGKNRQVRRMFEALDNRVVALRRLSIGPVSLGALSDGEVRPLTRAEITLLGGPGESRGDNG